MHGSALYAYGYIKEKPYGWTLSRGQKTHQNRVFRWTIPESFRFIRSPRHLCLEPQPLSLEATTFGIYDKERVICDCLKYESRLDRNDFKAAVQSYIADTDKDISVLMDYARARRVVKKVQSFIGVWL